MTVNRLCASGLEAVVQASRALRLGEGSLMLAGGVESMTRAPLVGLKPDRGFPRGGTELVDTTIGWRFMNPNMTHSTEGMGETGENVAERYGVSRADQDAFALESHRRAVAAAEAGRFDDELVTVDVPQPKGDPLTVHADEGPRPDTTAERLAGPEADLPRGRHGDRRQLVLAQRRRGLPGAGHRGRPLASWDASRWRASCRARPPAWTPPTWASGRCPRRARRSSARG